MFGRRQNSYGRGGGFNIGNARIGPGVPMPASVKWLLLANVAVYVLSRMPGVNMVEFELNFGLVNRMVFAEGHVWQLFTYMFLHGGLLHIGMNMFMLWMFGTTIAHQWGDREFLIYYFVCGVGGGLANWLVAPTSMGVTLGASGAVIGLLLAYSVMYPDQIVLLMGLLPMKMKYLMYGLIAIDLLAGLTSTQTGVAHFAHLGGVATGWLYLKQDWRLGAFSRKVRAQRAKIKMAQNTRQQTRRHAPQKEVDRILEKISSQGIESLTEAERNVLRDASRH